MSQIIVPASQFRTSGVRLITSNDLLNIDIPRETFIRNILSQYRGQTIQLALKYFDNEGFPIDETITEDIPNNYSSFWKSFSTFFWPDSEFFVFNQPGTELLIMTANRVGTSNYQQFFLDGITHCVFSTYD